MAPSPSTALHRRLEQPHTERQQKSEPQFKVGDKIQANLHGRVVDATVRAVVEYTHGIKLQVDFGHDETALVELRQLIK